MIILCAPAALPNLTLQVTIVARENVHSGLYKLHVLFCKIRRKLVDWLLCHDKFGAPHKMVPLDQT